MAQGIVEKRIHHYFFPFQAHMQSHNYCTAGPVAVWFAALRDEMYAQTAPERMIEREKKMGGRGKHRQKKQGKARQQSQRDTGRPKKQRRKDKGKKREGKERQSRESQGEGKQSSSSLCKHCG